MTGFFHSRPTNVGQYVCYPNFVRIRIAIFQRARLAPHPNFPKKQKRHEPLHTTGSIFFQRFLLGILWAVYIMISQTFLLTFPKPYDIIIKALQPNKKAVPFLSDTMIQGGEHRPLSDTCIISYLSLKGN